MTTMKPPAKRACRECPWRRASGPGFVGPNDPETWVSIAHTDLPVACHMTIPEDYEYVDEDDPEIRSMRQCTGMATFRGNICKSPRDHTVVALDPDRVTFFGRGPEFIEHHTIG